MMKEAIHEHQGLDILDAYDFSNGIRGIGLHQY